jgi:hypothetical protein
MFDRVIIWKAKRVNPDLSAKAIAQLVRKPTSTVRHALKLLEVAPKDMLQAFEHEAVTAWQEAIPLASAKGDHRPAKDLLLHTRAIDPVQLQGQQQIAIIFAGSLVPGLLSSPCRGDEGQINANVIDVPRVNVTDTAVAVPVQQETPESEHRRGPAGGSG